jgi:hypothetical protein
MFLEVHVKGSSILLSYGLHKVYLTIKVTSVVQCEKFKTATEKNEGRKR